MTTVLTDAPETKARRRVPARATARPAAKKTKVTVVLPDDAAKKLGVYAMMTSQDRSEVVARLIYDQLRRFRVHDLDRPESAAPTEEVSAA